MPITILYFDDQHDEGSHAERVRDRLSRSGRINCILLQPPDDVAAVGSMELPGTGAISENPPDLFLVDQDLTTVNYYGSTLVAELRSQFPEAPIVIITRRSVLTNLGPEKSRQLVEEIQTFDELILKDVVDDYPEDTEVELVVLAEGFRVLRQKERRTWTTLVALTGAEEAENDSLRETAPPLHGRGVVYEDQKNEWTVTGAASWLRNTILGYPGILYDPIHAATRLQISVASFRRDDVQGEIDGSRYEGVFSPMEGRWWNARLLGMAQTFVIEQLGTGRTMRAFAEAFQRKYEVDLEPSICVWDGSSLADQVCSVLQKPVKTEHSLRYYPDTRPSIMDPARVSFRAIQESDQFDDELLDSSGRKLLSKIQNLPDPRVL